MAFPKYSQLSNVPSAPERAQPRMPRLPALDKSEATQRKTSQRASGAELQSAAELQLCLLMGFWRLWPWLPNSNYWYLPNPVLVGHSNGFKGLSKHLATLDSCQLASKLVLHKCQGLWKKDSTLVTHHFIHDSRCFKHGVQTCWLLTPECLQARCMALPSHSTRHRKH